MDWKLVDRDVLPRYIWFWMLVVGFLGYAIGRIGSILWGYMDIMHHWVPAIFIIGISPFLQKHWWWVLVLAFGIGFLISDLDDFINLRFWGVDTAEPRFWGVD